MTAVAASPSTIGERVERLLLLREISGRDLAMRAGLDPSHVNGLIRSPPEKQEKVSLSTLQQIARAAGVRLAWLAANDGAMLEPGTPDPERFASRLARVMQIRGVTDKDIDARLGKKRPYVAALWLRSNQRKLPDNDEVIEAARMLGVSFEWLRYGLGSMGDPGPPPDATGLGEALRVSVKRPDTHTAVKTAEKRVVPFRRPRRTPKPPKVRS